MKDVDSLVFEVKIRDLQQVIDLPIDPPPEAEKNDLFYTKSLKLNFL